MMKKTIIVALSFFIAILIGCQSEGSKKDTTNASTSSITTQITENKTTSVQTTITKTTTTLAPTTEEFIMPDLNFIVFGDSISEGYYAENNYGWVKMLKDGYNATMADYAKGGYATINYLNDFEDKLKAGLNEERMNVLVIALGINDSIIHMGEDYVTLIDYINNMSSFVTTAKKYVSNIVLVGITRVDESRTDPINWSTVDQRYHNDRIEKYDQAMKSIASSKRVHYISLENVLSTDTKYNYDGCHPTSLGHQEIYNLIKADLDVYLEEMARQQN